MRNLKTFMDLKETAAHAFLFHPPEVHPLFIFNFLFIKIPHRLSSIKHFCRGFQYVEEYELKNIEDYVRNHKPQKHFPFCFTQQPCLLQQSVIPSYCHSCGL